MNEETRRLIYELVEAKGMKESQDKVKQTSESMKQLVASAKQLAGGPAVAFSIKGIADTLGEIQKIELLLKTLGLTSEQAALGLQSIENAAVTSGQAIADVAAVYATAVEITQRLGGTMGDAAKLTDAFTRAAVAEGKGAAQAAETLGLLNQAMDKGTIKAKQLATIFKESETFQSAAEEAFGATTTQILRMADAGEIGVEQLDKVIDKFAVLSANLDVPVTLDSITSSLTSAGKAFINATAGALGLNQALSNGNAGAWQDFLDILRLVGTALGFVLRLIFNLIETVGQFAIALTKALASPTDALEIFDVFSQQVVENMDDIAKGAKEVSNAWKIARGEMKAPGTDDVITNSRNAELRRFEESQRLQEQLEKFNEETRRMREANEEERRRDNEKALRESEENFRRIGQQQADADRVARQMKKEQDDYFAKTREDALKAAEKQLEKDAENDNERWDKMMAERTAIAEDSAAAIANAFEGLFDGSIRNARDFFKSILQGMAQMAMQRATSGLQDWLGTIFKSAASAAADGAAFQRGTLVPFASGGVVSGPTVFPMSSGRMGLMGEAGAEAVMPLRRGSNGQLGVTGTMPRIQIVNNLGVAANASVEGSGDRMSIVLEAAQLGAQMAESAVNRSLRSGYGSTAQSVQRTYGLRRRF